MPIVKDFITLRAKLSGAVYCNRSCLCVCVFATGGRAVSEPYYSQRARSVCVSLSAFFIIVAVATCVGELPLILKIARE